MHGGMYLSPQLSRNNQAVCVYSSLCVFITLVLKERLLFFLAGVWATLVVCGRSPLLLKLHALETKSSVIDTSVDSF